MQVFTFLCSTFAITFSAFNGLGWLLTHAGIGAVGQHVIIVLVSAVLVVISCLVIAESRD